MALLKMAQISLHRLHRPAEAYQLFFQFKISYPDSIWSVAAEDGMREAQQAMAGPVVPWQPAQAPAGYPGAVRAHQPHVVAAATARAGSAPAVAPGVAAPYRQAAR